MPVSLSQPMRVLVDDFKIVDVLTTKLLSLQDENPEVDRFIGWHPAFFKQELDSYLPQGARTLLHDRSLQYSFYRELKAAPGIISFHARTYPTLVRIVKGNLGYDPGGECILSVEYCQYMFHKIENNVSSIRELATVLETNGEKPWFPVPVPIPVDEAITRQAMLHALATFAKQNPRKFPAMVKSSIHDMGYDKDKISAKEILALVEEMIHESK